MANLNITLNPVQDQYFAEVAYSLDLPHKKASISDIYNHMLGELAAFEKITGDQLSNWLNTNYHTQYQNYLKENREEMNSDYDRRLIKKLVKQAK